MSNDNHRQRQSMQERMSSKEKRTLPELIRYSAYLCPIVITIFLVLYTTGAWQARFDEVGRLKDFDTIISTTMVALGIYNIIIAWFTHHLFEKD